MKEGQAIAVTHVGRDFSERTVSLITPKLYTMVREIMPVKLVGKSLVTITNFNDI